jgi:predicted dehydrogenase
MESGVTVSYSATWAARGKFTSWDGNITLTGNQGCLQLDNQDKVWFYRGDSSEPELLSRVEMDHTELAHALRHMIDLIENGGTAETTLQDNFHSYAMVCAGEKAVKAGGFAIPASL